MSGLALGTAVAMLTFFATGLFLALQHINDRYTPLLMPTLLRHTIVWLPLLILIVFLVAAGVLVLLPNQLVPTIVAFAVLLGAIAAGLFATYKVLVFVSDGTKLLPLLKGSPHRQPALEAIIWNAIGRADRRVTAATLRASLETKGDSEEAFFDWLLKHRELLATDWLARELLDVTLANSLNTPSLEQRTDVLCAMLREALDAEAFSRARDIVEMTLTTLAHAKPWTKKHGYLLYKMGFAVWNLGERGASDPRTSRIPSQLADTKAEFIAQTRDVWFHVYGLGDTKAATAYAWAIGELAEDIPDNDAREWFLSRIFDVLADGFEHHVLTQGTMEELACSLGRVRHRLDPNDEEIQEQIDDLVVQLGATFLELPEDEDAGETTPEEEIQKVAIIKVDALVDNEPVKSTQSERIDRLHHLLANGYLFARLRAHKKPRVNQQDWLKPESYQIVAHELGLKHFE